MWLEIWPLPIVTSVTTSALYFETSVTKCALYFVPTLTTSALCTFLCAQCDHQLVHLILISVPIVSITSQCATVPIVTISELHWTLSYRSM